MDYSIDGEEVSHSPRTQEKNGEEVLEKVRFRLLRSSMRPMMASLTRRLSQHPSLRVRAAVGS